MQVGYVVVQFLRYLYSQRIIHQIRYTNIWFIYKKDNIIEAIHPVSTQGTT